MTNKKVRGNSSGQDHVESILQELKDVKYALDQSTIVAITNQRGIIQYVNEHFCNISQYTKEELIGQNHNIINSNYHSHEFFKNMWATIGTGNVWQGEIRNQAKDRTYYWVDTTIVPFLNDRGKPYQYVSIRHNITKRKQMEKRVKQSEAKYRLITENMLDMVSIIDQNGNFQYLSPSHEQSLGYCIEDMYQTSLFDYVQENDREMIKQHLADTHPHQAGEPVQFQMKKKDGTYIYIETNMNLIQEEKNVHELVLSMRDITKRKKSEEEILHLAFHDTLTELPNRRYFMNHLQDEIERTKQTKGKLAVLFLDLDRLKYINDAWGHDVGDLVLISVTERINESLRSTDILARLGGDEFTVLLPNINNKWEVDTIIKRLKDKFRTPLNIANHQFFISFSIGISLYPDDGTDADELLARADTALYYVKERGRGDHAFFNPQMEEQSLERNLLENELEKAIKKEQFHLDYQPKIDFQTKKVIGMEALIRWDHPEIGRIPPNEFIPLAETTGLIVQIGEWVVREACKQNKLWQKKGYDDMLMSVNVSVRQLADPQFLQMIKDVLLETGLQPCHLELEITESTFVDMEEAVTILEELRKIGVIISIDDFGTGYSSFSYIKKLPVDTVKIDASFIQDIHENEESKAIVSAIITLAKSLNMTVIAEGVEEEEQLQFLAKDGCKLGQGYLFSKPLSSKNFEQYLQETIRVT